MEKFYDVDLEWNLLCKALINHEALLEVVDLDDEDIYDGKNRVFFQAIKKAWDNNKQCDLMLLKHELELAGQFETLGGDGFLVKVSQSYHIVNVGHVITIIRKYSRRRKLYMALSDAREMISERTGDSDEMLEKLHKDFTEIDAGKQGHNVTTFAEVVSGGIGSLVEDGYCTTGVKDIDDIITGFYEGELIVLAARPSLGKTTLGLQIASNISMNKEVLFFSLEMPAKQLAIKMLSRHNRIEGSRIRARQLSEDEFNKLQGSYHRLSKHRLTFVTSCYTLSGIANTTRKFSMRRQLGAVFIDYMQLVEVKSKEPRYVQVAEISRQLKKLAGEIKAPVIAMAQLSRGAEDNTPKLSDLRESGSIEQDADQVIFIDNWRNGEGKGKLSPTGGEVNVISAKHRMGRVGYAKMWFDKQYSDFRGTVIPSFENSYPSMEYIHD